MHSMLRWAESLLNGTHARGALAGAHLEIDLNASSPSSPASARNPDPRSSAPWPPSAARPRALKDPAHDHVRRNADDHSCSSHQVFSAKLALNHVIDILKPGQGDLEFISSSLLPSPPASSRKPGSLSFISLAAPRRPARVLLRRRGPCREWA